MSPSVWKMRQLLSFDRTSTKPLAHAHYAWVKYETVTQVSTDFAEPI